MSDLRAQAGGFRYRPTNPDILHGFSSEPQDFQPNDAEFEYDQIDPVVLQLIRALPSSLPEPSLDSDPLQNALHQQDIDLEAAYLRSLNTHHNISLIDDNPYFGQRYAQPSSSSPIAITRKRVTAAVINGMKECVVCTETLPAETHFSPHALSLGCDHEPSTCSECVAKSIASDLETKMWYEVRCPECRAPMEYQDVERYADRETFRRYESHSANTTLTTLPTHIWCPSPVCSTGYFHFPGSALPLATCPRCRFRACFRHRGAWHEGLTCEEVESVKHKHEEVESEKTVGRTTKKCPGPGCAARIEKNAGCRHMTCTACKWQFCWECMKGWTTSHSCR